MTNYLINQQQSKQSFVLSGIIFFGGTLFLFRLYKVIVEYSGHSKIELVLGLALSALVNAAGGACFGWFMFKRHSSRVARAGIVSAVSADRS